MQWLNTLLTRLRFLKPRSTRRQIDEELQFHLEHQIAQNLAAGMSPEQARLAAMRTFGNQSIVTEQVRETWSFTWLERLLQDIRFATRQIARAPGFAIIAILTLALGIGANNAVFTLTHALLLSNIPVQDPGQLVRLAIDLQVANPDANNAPLDLPIIEAIRKQARSFNGVFGWCVYDFVYEPGNGVHGIHGAIVSGNTFQVLGVHPAAGRLLTPADDQAGGGPDGWAGVISHRLWMQQYHADPSVIGKRISITDKSVTIVGVAPQGFEGIMVAEHPDIYLPLEFDGALNGEQGLHAPGRLWLTTFARLKPGVTREQATAEMAILFPKILDEIMPPAVRHLPEVLKSKFDVDPARTGWSTLRLQYTQPLLLLQMLVGAVLLICCANLSGLFLARASTRQHEFAIRGALGASRSRLMRQLFVESLMLALPGAILGLLIAWSAGPWILHSLGNRQAEVSLSARPDGVVLAVTAACAVLCALLFGMAPAWTASHTSVEAALRSSNPRATAGSAGVRRYFVPLQVALSLALVVVATLLGSTVVHLRTENSGYRTENVIFVLTDFNRMPQKNPELVTLYRRMVARMEEQPGVTDASVAEIPPLLGWRDEDNFVAAEKAAHTQPSMANTNRITAHYFSAVGTPLLAGRDLRNEDADASSFILNQNAAQHYFPNESAIGKTLNQVSHNMNTGTDTSTSCQIIGIAQDSKYDSLHQAIQPIVYLPVTADAGALRHLFFVIHAQNIAAATAAYRTTLHELAPASPEIAPSLFTQQFNDSIAREQLLSVLSGFFAALALLLSGIGIYGLVSWNVTQRTTEIGVRMALGATRVRVFLLVMRQVAALLAIGVAAGGIASLFAAKSIKSFLFEVQPTNPAIFLAGALALVAIGLLAAMLPARRAITIQPMQALRTE
jgi:predicted permease